MTATVVDEISSSKYRKGNGHRANFKGHPGKTCSKSHPLRECSAWGKNVISVETKIIVCVVGPGTEKIPKAETNTDRPIESQNKRRSRSRHRRYASEDS